MHGIYRGRVALGMWRALAIEPRRFSPYSHSMRSPAPPWLNDVDDLSDSDRYAEMTPAERLACFVEICELSRRILEDRPDRREVLARTEPMPPQAERTWLRLVAEARRVRSAR